MEVGTKMTMIANLTDPSTKRNMIAKPRPPAAPSPTSTASRRRLKYLETKHDQDDDDCINAGDGDDKYGDDNDGDDKRIPGQTMAGWLTAASKM